MLAIIDIDSQRDESASGDAVRHIATIAEQQGLRTYRVPRDFDSVGGPDNALWHVPSFDKPVEAIWVGYMVPPERYRVTYDALRTRNIHLVNDPAEHLRAEEFDSWYPTLKRYTCASETVTSPEAAVAAARRIGLPVFLKGVVQSLKVEGLSGCSATSESEVAALSRRLLHHASRTRGRVIVREMMALRSGRIGPTGMPAAREFRVFVLDGAVADLGYYWPFSDPLAALDPSERRAIEQLAVAVQQAIDVPWLAVDIGQLDSGEWQMIEIGDAQFAGICGASPYRILDTLRSRES